MSHLFFLQTGAVHEEFYKDCDLMIGGEVNVWGRKVTLSDCDDFTKDYYRNKYGRGNQYCYVRLFQSISSFVCILVEFPVAHACIA